MTATGKASINLSA